MDVENSGKKMTERKTSGNSKQNNDNADDDENVSKTKKCKKYFPCVSIDNETNGQDHAQRQANQRSPHESMYREK